MIRFPALTVHHDKAGMENIVIGIQPNLDAIKKPQDHSEITKTNGKILSFQLNCKSNSPASSTPISFTMPKKPKPSKGLSSLAARSAIALPSSRQSTHPLKNRGKKK